VETFGDVRRPGGAVRSVSLGRAHAFSKEVRPSITLVAGRGVEGDAHSGETVRHRSRVRADPAQPNLRQVHLIHAELFDELRSRGFAVGPGDLGENVTTVGLDLLSLPRDAELHIGPSAVVGVTGLRNPCRQLDDFQQGLMEAVLDRGPSGELIRKVGIMGVVLAGGPIRPGDPIGVALPAGPHRRLERV
jgi:MOSC domain-containing protein YiiM